MVQQSQQDEHIQQQDEHIQQQDERIQQQDERIQQQDERIQQAIYEIQEKQELNGLDIRHKHMNNMLFIQLRFKDNSGGYCSGAFKLSQEAEQDLEIAIKEINQTLQDIKEQVTAIDSLNAIVKEQMYKINNQFNVQYCWGYNEKCSIEDWQYQFIKIKLSKEACEKIRDTVKENQQQLEEVIQKTEFGQNAAEVVHTFDCVEFHQWVGAVLYSSDIEVALTQHMVQMDTAIRFIAQANKKQGTQQIRIVIPFNELGQFLILVDWEINYSNKTIKQTILEQKILDIENRKYILDSQIYNRVEKRIAIQKDVVANLFES